MFLSQKPSLASNYLDITVLSLAFNILHDLASNYFSIPT